MFTRALLVTAATILVVRPSSAQAHRPFEFAVALGAYVPTGDMPDATFYGTDECRLHPESPTCAGPVPRSSGSSNAAGAVGARLTTWLGAQGAIDGAFWFSPGGAGPYMVGSVRGVLDLAPKAPTISVLLMGGPAVIHRSGDETSFGGTVGIGLDIHPSTGISLRAGIEDYVYDGVGGPHHDFVVSFSVGADAGL